KPDLHDLRPMSADEPVTHEGMLCCWPLLTPQVTYNGSLHLARVDRRVGGQMAKPPWKSFDLTRNPAGPPPAVPHEVGFSQAGVSLDACASCTPPTGSWA